MDKRERERLGFREQVGMFFGGQRESWLTVREGILREGGNMGDVVTILIWRLQNQGAEGKAGSVYHA